MHWLYLNLAIPTQQLSWINRNKALYIMINEWSRLNKELEVMIIDKCNILKARGEHEVTWRLILVRWPDHGALGVWLWEGWPANTCTWRDIQISTTPEFWPQNFAQRRGAPFQEPQLDNLVQRYHHTLIRGLKILCKYFFHLHINASHRAIPNGHKLSLKLTIFFVNFLGFGTNNCIL